MWIYQNSLLFVAMITQSIERKMYTFLIVGGDKSGIFDVGWLIGQYQKSTHLLPTDKPFCNWRLGVTDVSGGKRQSFPFKISAQIDWYAHFLWQSRPSPNPPPPLASGLHTRSGAAIYSSVYYTIPQLFDISSSRPQINLSLLIRNFYAFSKHLELEGPH